MKAERKTGLDAQYAQAKMEQNFTRTLLGLKD